MNDPRKKLYSFLEGLDGDNAEAAGELKESMKAWSENEVRLKTEAIATREEAEGKLTEFETQHNELNQKLEEMANTTTEPSAELQEMQKKLQETNTALDAMRAETAEKDNALFVGGVRSDFLKATELKDEFAESRIDLAIAQGNVRKAEDGTVEIVVGTDKFTPVTFASTLAEQYPTQLKNIAGGKQGGLDGKDPQPTDPSKSIANDVAKGTNGLVQFRGM